MLRAAAPALVAGAGFAGVALAGLAGLRIGSRLRGAAIGIAAGILLAVAFAELLPEALEEGGHRIAAMWFLGGFAALFVVEVVTRGHTHHEGGEEHVEHTSLTPFLAGLLLHNLVDGAVLAAGVEASTQAATAVSVGILVHQLPVGVSFAAVAAAAGATRRSVVGWALVLGAAIPAGALVTAALPGLEGEHLGALLGAAGGALAYIGAGHLLPEAHAEHPSLFVSALFPAALLSTAVLLLYVLHG
ncbi:MAG TPA: ZIP family metal transporter [Solirubrobacteraceae bacterium]|nr:ZIP family metal transporter [Solirubrobacteraceae bacterium]